MPTRTRRAGAVTVAALTLVGLGCRRQHPAPPALPRLALSPEQAAAVTRLELTRPDDDGQTTIVLERSGQVWRLTAPVRARASAGKVAELLANLQDLKVWARLDAGTAFYDRYDLTGARALHVVAETAGRRRLVDFFAGKSSEQGQLIRLPDVPGLFALVNEGSRRFQGFLYTRDLRGWRDPGLWSFDEADVESVEIDNPHGHFLFARRGGRWSATRAARRDGPPAPWPRFDGRRVDELLHAYHALAADDFGGEQDRARSGVGDAESSGGVLRIHPGHGTDPLVVRVGAPAPGGSRFAIAGSRWAAVPGDDEDLYLLSPWTARWAVGDADLFERAP